MGESTQISEKTLQYDDLLSVILKEQAIYRYKQKSVLNKQQIDEERL